MDTSYQEHFPLIVSATSVSGMMMGPHVFCCGTIDVLELPQVSNDYGVPGALYGCLAASLAANQSG